jgi:hypothetical protein
MTVRLVNLETYAYRPRTRLSALRSSHSALRLLLPKSPPVALPYAKPPKSTHKIFLSVFWLYLGGGVEGLGEGGHPRGHREVQELVAHHHLCVCVCVYVCECVYVCVRVGV